MTPRALRTLGLIACLIGALVMIAARFGGHVPLVGIWIGLGVILFGWVLFALSTFRRPRGSNG